VAGLVGFHPEDYFESDPGGTGNECPQQMYPPKHSFTSAEVQNYLGPVFVGPFLSRSWLAASGRSTEGHLTNRPDLDHRN